MREFVEDKNCRRRFLRLLAASSLLAFSGFSLTPLKRQLLSGGESAANSLAVLENIAQGEDLITSPEQALNVMEFEAVARKKLPPAHFGYLATGVDDDVTLRANREGFARLQIRVRRLVDVPKIDMSVCSALLGIVQSCWPQ